MKEDNVMHIAKPSVLFNEEGNKTESVIYLLSLVETPRKFIIAIINLRGVSTKLNKYIVFTMQTYKKLETRISNIKNIY